MQPTLIIPTFWTGRRKRGRSEEFVYDHPTPIDSDGTLPGCLRSLEQLEDLGKVIVTVAATSPSIEHEAEDRVRDIVADFPGLDVLVFGSAEIGSLHRRLEQLEFADMIDGVTLGGYGAVRNTGLIVAAALGSDAVVFVDDDQVVTDPSFLETGTEGLGAVTQGGRPILAKSGYYVDEQGSYVVSDDAPWCDMFWRQNELYTEAISALAQPPRMQPSTLAFGGCLALHRDMYCSVPFDPWVSRGEDMDYVVNARMHGGDVFLDDQWSIVHRPPLAASEAALFRLDVFRFVYIHRKLEFSKSQVDLRQVTPDSLRPYPGRLVDSSVGWRASVTAALRALAGRERGAYLKIARSAVRSAEAYARENCERYFSFQRRWPLMMDVIWEDVALKSLFTGERRVDRGAITGRFPVIRSD